VKRLDFYWADKNLVAVLLLPLAGLFIGLAALRRAAYRLGIFNVTRLPVPVIVVGNITVGGTGKTPLTMWLVQRLRDAGFTPGVISRGYGGRASTWPQWVTADSDPTQVGDEPVLIAQRTACPLAVAPQRVAAARMLLERAPCDVLICDDGLQHYALARDVEIAVVDAARNFGNGWRLPAGPLRESVVRLRTVDFVVMHGVASAAEFSLQLELTSAYNLRDTARVRDIISFASGVVHAVAGIGHPARFFEQLRASGVQLVEHPFPDHHVYTPGDLNFGDDLPVLMTEKDAVKCRAFAAAHCWAVTAQARVDERLATLVIEKLKKVNVHG
jgi:tetraacyldisaccharide 4'-kinase